MFALIDTETSGLFDYKKPADADGQPRLAAFAAIVLDAKMAEIESVAMLVRPDGWVMEQGAGSIHGLTTETLIERGWPIGEVLGVYQRLVKSGCTLVGYNIHYDAKIMRGELRRAGLPDLYDDTKTLCVMRPLTGVVQKPDGRKGFPKLVEACRHFGIDLPKAHDAMTDARATLALFGKMREAGLC